MKETEQIRKYLEKNNKRIPAGIICALERLDHKAEMFQELRYHKHDEISDENYLVISNAYISDYDGEVNYGLSIYKWDGTYNEKQLAFQKKPIKLKNWQEIYHATCGKRPDIKKELELLASGKFEKKQKVLFNETDNTSDK